jgi:hypothetical protein
VAGVGIVTLIGVTAGGPAHATGAARSAPDRAGTTNSNFAGYQVNASKKRRIKSATETFVIPAITCKKNFSGVGPAAIVDSTVNKRTNTFTGEVAAVGVACSHKQPIYQSIIQVGGKLFNDQPTLAAGDHVDVTVTMGKRKVTATLDDLTSHTRFTHSGKGATGASASLGGATLGINHHTVGLDPFGKLRITGAEVNGKSLKAEKAERVTWINKKHPKHILVTASRLKAAGKNFVLTFKRSQ